jgi:hypothetical protein
MDFRDMISLGERTRDHYRREDVAISDHVITDVAATRLKKKTPRVSGKLRGAPEKLSPLPSLC